MPQAIQKKFIILDNRNNRDGIPLQGYTDNSVWQKFIQVFFFHSLTLKKMNIERGYEHVRSKMGVRRLFLDPRRLIFTHVLTEMNVIEDIRAVAV